MASKNENGHAVNGEIERRYDTQGYADRAAPAPGDDGPAVNPLLLVHRALRGRYIVAAVLGLILAVGAGLAVFTTYVPKYVSRGIIEVAPERQTLLYEDLGAFEMREGVGGFIATQIEYLRQNERIHNLAIQEFGLAELGWPTGHEGRRQLRQAIDVSHPRNASVITIAARHQEPPMAQEIVGSVMEAYLRYSEEAESLSAAERAGLLRQRRERLEVEISGLREERSGILREYGTVEDLDEQYRAIVERRNQIASAIEQVDAQIERIDASPVDENDQGIDVSQIALDRLAQLDSQLGRYIGERDRLRLRLEELRQTVGEAHPEIRRLTPTLEVIENAIAQTAAEVRQRIAEGDIVVSAEELGIEALSREQLVEQRDEYEVAQRELLLRDERLLATLNEVERLTSEIGIKTSNLNDVRNILDRYEFEQLANPRGFERVSLGGEPTSPEEERGKRALFSAAAGAAGFGFGVALVTLWGLLDRRFRYVEELSSSDLLPPLVGVIPKLNQRDSESLKFAALAVHHVRNTLMLHHPSRSSRARVFTVTSASAGDGKTNLARALGRSFAESGYQTLLVDADFVGHGMTTDQGLEGEAGLCEAVLADHAGEVEPVSGGVDKLWILPAGRDLHAERLRRESLKRALTELAEAYEVIVVDTGPILGSLEAGFVAVEADAVLTVVSRGRIQQGGTAGRLA